MVGEHDRKTSVTVVGLKNLLSHYVLYVLYICKASEESLLRVACRPDHHPPVFSPPFPSAACLKESQLRQHVPRDEAHAEHAEEGYEASLASQPKHHHTLLLLLLLLFLGGRRAAVNDQPVLLRDIELLVASLVGCDGLADEHGRGRRGRRRRRRICGVATGYQVRLVAGPGGVAKPQPHLKKKRAQSLANSEEKQRQRSEEHK